MAYLLDTCLISELRRASCNPGVAAWMSKIDPNEVSLSVITLGEIRRGIELHRSKDAKAAGNLHRTLIGAPVFAFLLPRSEYPSYRAARS
jgi:predicted nucleic acid-binding protein